MKQLVPLVSLIALSACSSMRGETSIADQVTSNPIKIPVARSAPSPITAAFSATSDLVDPLQVRHEADDAIRPFQRVERANRAAKIEPGLENFVNAVQVYPYTEGGLYQLYTAPGQVSLVSLQRGEELISVSAGDTSRWMVGDTSSGSGAGAQVSIIVKPLQANLTTNLVIATSKRTYLLELRSFRSTYMAALSWRYPLEEALALRAKDASSIDHKASFKTLHPGAVTFRYTINGPHPDWRPVRVFDDARKTYIEFSPKIDTSETPPLFLIGSSGEPELVNYRMRGNFYIVDRLFEKAELRLGGKDQIIVSIARQDDVDQEAPNVR